jgi:hemolysin activation/secretion protein
VQVTLQRVAIAGNTRIASAELLAALGPVAGQTYDFAGLSRLAARVGAYYQKAGYPVARAYLPQQDLSGGELRIAVLEGQYGLVQATGDAAFTRGAQGFLSALPKGALIEAGRLERTTLLLNDQPGIVTAPMMRPGQDVGSGDLIVDVQRDHRYKGEAGIDNYGTRATGRTRLHASLDADSPFMLGDQLSVQALYTDAHMWFGSVAYTAPVGYSGLRAKVSYTHSFYELAGSFAALGARGTADVTSLVLSYPVIRSQSRNLIVSASIDHKKLNDSQQATSTATSKASSVVPVNVSFDVRDGFLHGGITYGAVSWVHGHLGLDGASAALDDASARTAGGFSKLNVDLARVQSVNSRVDLYGRLSIQRAANNLDPSEKLGLGGVNGVRAYPNGEAFGDNGWLVQGELRYALGDAAPYVFYDAGRIDVSKNAWSTTGNRRALAGAGLGVRYTGAGWIGGVSIAWRTQGGAAQSDPKAKSPTALLNLAYRF